MWPRCREKNQSSIKWDKCTLSIMKYHPTCTIRIVLIDLIHCLYRGLVLDLFILQHWFLNYMGWNYSMPISSGWIALNPPHCWVLFFYWVWMALRAPLFMSARRNQKKVRSRRAGLAGTAAVWFKVCRVRASWYSVTGLAFGVCSEIGWWFSTMHGRFFGA